jgi:hypothetical protein
VRFAPPWAGVEPGEQTGRGADLVLRSNSSGFRDRLDAHPRKATIHQQHERGGPDRFVNVWVERSFHLAKA